MKKILIVDDSPVFRNTIRGFIERDGHEIAGEAGNAEEVFSFLATTTPDLILLDLLMPGKSGLEILKNIHASNPEINILVVTAVNQQAINDEAMKLGAKGIVYKPFDPEELTKEISKI